MHSHQLRSLRIFAIAAFILLLTNCISEDLKNIEDLKKCKVDFNTIKVKNIASSGIFGLAPKIVFDTELEITNPNESPVTIYAFDFNIFLLQDGSATKEDLLGQILFDEEVTIPAMSSKIIPIKVRSEFEEGLNSKLIRIGLKLLNDLQNNRETEFLIEGYVKYNTFMGSINLPVSEIQKAKIR